MKKQPKASPQTEASVAEPEGVSPELPAELASDAAAVPAPVDFYSVTSGRDEAAVMVLFRRMRGPVESLRFGDRQALRDHLVLVHTPLVEHCARGFVASGEPLEDLVQQGYVGLIKGVDRYDPEKGVRFSTYACHLITGEIRHYLRDLGRLIHEPGWHFELRQRISRVTDQLTQRLSRAPEAEEIAAALNVRVETVRDVLKSQHMLTVDSLDEPANEYEESSGGIEWMAEAGSGSAPVEAQVDDQLLLGSALPQLRELEKKVVSLFFFEELSKTEIARRLNISVNYSAYLVKRGLEHLRQIVEAGEALPAEVMTGSAARSQQHARSVYLLALASGGNGGGTAASDGSRRKTKRAGADRRNGKVGSAVPALRRSKVAAFPQFVLWLDEEVERAARYAQEFAVLWLQIRNWKEATEGLEGEATGHAMAAVEALMRRHCRGVDKVATMSSEALPGLHFLVLMPHTGPKGRKVGERWLESCRTDAAYFSDPDALARLDPAYAFAVYSADGKTSDELFRCLGGQLNVAE